MKAVVKRLGLAVLTAKPVYRVLRGRALRKQPVTILCYHTLRADHEDLDIWLALRMRDFVAQITALRKDYDIVSLEDALQPALPNARPRMVLTFDDGEWAMQAHLLPFLEAEKLPVTLYVATQQIETGQPYWFDRVMNALQSDGALQIDLCGAGLGTWTVGPDRGERRWHQIGAVLEALKARPEDERDRLSDMIVAQMPERPETFTAMAPMTLAALKDVAQSPYVTIGAHTHGHELLDQLPLEHARASIRHSQKLLEKWTGQEVRHFAYPNGNYTSELMQVLTDLNFATATILEDRLVHSDDPAMALPRVSVGRYDALARLRLRMVGI